MCIRDRLWVLALAGLVCIVLVVLAFTAHITLIMFRTGSMAPTIPAGSVAIVQQIPASQVHVGDAVSYTHLDVYKRQWCSSPRSAVC